MRREDPSTVSVGVACSRREGGGGGGNTDNRKYPWGAESSKETCEFRSYS